MKLSFVACSARRWALVCSLTVATGFAQAQTAGRTVAFPYYNAAHVWLGLYHQHLPERAKAFEAAAQQLQVAVQTRCEQTGAAPGLQSEWLRALQTWQALATPAVGPLLERRSQRQIDFWPARPALIEKALRQAPHSLDDLERVGTPAKGFPGLEWLLAQPPQAERCRYADLVAQGLVAEAQALVRAFQAQAEQAPEDDPEALGPSFAEWVNQWLGGWERLRWAHIEQPIQKARTARRQPEFARRDRAANVADWQAQWQALRAQARLRPEQAEQPPRAGEALIPIEALLLGKGHMALAAQWAQALDRVDAEMARLSARSSDQELLALAQRMKAVTVLFQNHIATALDVPLGFSDADGD